MELKERIEAVLTYTNLSASAFAKEIGVRTKQTIYDLTSGKTRTLSADVLGKIQSCYPSISVEWLMTGNGEMLRDSVSQTSFGDNSPNVKGDNNQFGGQAALDATLAEMAEQRKLFERLLEKKDSQIDRLLTILETKK